MLKKVPAGRLEKITCLKDLSTLLVLIFLSFTNSWAQEKQSKELVHKKSGLRYRIVNNDTIYSLDSNPVFPGGETAMINYLQKKIVYPEVSRKNGKEGLVKAKFVVKKSGEIGDIAILEEVDPHIDSLVVKIIKEMPVWQPARQGQTAFAVRYTLPVRFTLLTEAERRNIREYNADGLSFRHFRKLKVSGWFH